MKKGSKLYIEGKLTTRSWEDKETKQKRYKTEIVVFDLSLLSAREDGSGAGRAATSAASFDQRTPAAADSPDEYTQQTEISDADIPF